MKLTELKVEEFINELGSNAPAPGGGSAAALAGSMGAALGAMVASLTVGREKYKDNEELMQSVLKEATEYKEELLEYINKDTEAFNQVSAVFKMPKDTEEEKLARKEAMAKALKNATIVPYEVMVICKKALLVIEKSVGKSNVNASSDLAVGALSLKTGAQSAWLNVLINLSSIKDEVFVNEYKEKGSQILKEIVSIADKIYEEIEKSF